MRKSLLLLAAIGPLAALGGLALPAAAESGEASCAAASKADAGPLDLEAVPVKPVTGPQAIQGAGIDDECDDMAAVGQVGQVGQDDVRAVAGENGDGRLGDNRGESDD
jgi:hypothetical protein